MVAAVTLAALAIFTGGAAIALLPDPVGFGAVAAVTFLNAFFAAIVSEEAAARWRLHAAIDDRALTAMLPRRRGFRRSAPLRRSIPLADVARLERRLEFFSAFLGATHQEAYEIVLRDGERIFLGADRAGLRPHYGDIARKVAEVSRAECRDLGAVEGRCGFLLIAGVTTPPWTEPSLTEEATRALTERARLTIAVVSIVTLIATVAALIAHAPD